ncbi:MAG TPA: type II toxin-antitoxin system RelE/ParE family toxin [Pyrinomonadaceae bacterium]|nr:type II toxin-antitoxin system RelE/ParE family toxin [Pyrinomonadaceae bacterium]
MRLEFHRQVSADISQIMDYYEGVAGPKLADEFYTELRFFFQKAANSPEAYDIREHDLRRVNLERFPYHFFFRLVRDRVRILVVRHHRRHPSLGLDRR